MVWQTRLRIPSPIRVVVAPAVCMSVSCLHAHVMSVAFFMAHTHLAIQRQTVHRDGVVTADGDQFSKVFGSACVRSCRAVFGSTSRCKRGSCLGRCMGVCRDIPNVHLAAPCTCLGRPSPAAAPREILWCVTSPGAGGQGPDRAGCKGPRPSLSASYANSTAKTQTNPHPSRQQ